MTARLAAFAALAALFPLAAGAADDDNPYKSVKVGDYVKYKTTVKVAGQVQELLMTQTVTAKTEKEVTVKGEVKANGKDIPAQEQKIDITKPYDPTAAANLPPGADLKVEKLKDGKETVKVGGKEYAATWTSYKMKGKAMGIDLDAEMKVWMAKDVPMGTVKMEMTTSVLGQKMEMQMEMTESGTAKK